MLSLYYIYLDTATYSVSSFRLQTVSETKYAEVLCRGRYEERIHCTLEL